MAADSVVIRRFAGRALVAGLSVAAAAAIVALLTGSFDDTDLRIVLTSIGFALASATASSGAGARLRPAENIRTLGGITVLASVAAFVLLVAGLGAILPISGIVDDVDDAWGRLFGAALVALVLTSVLPPILRRFQTSAPGRDSFASEVVQLVDRIDLLNSDPGNRAPEIRAELRRLRELARSVEK
jgi:O-antigen/teichoic acid export membrane protein